MLTEIDKVLQKIDYSTEEGYLAWSEKDPWPITSTTYGTIIFEPIDEGTDYTTYILHYVGIHQRTGRLRFNLSL